MLAALLLATTLSPFDQVVAAERAFAAASLQKGLHEAFLANLAPDAIAFVPLPAPARPAHEGQPPSSVRLSWGPSWVAVSSSGDLALSTGPWQVSHHEKTPIKVSTGWFFSVWRRQPDGIWKVVVDSGIASPVKFVLPSSVENGFAGSPVKAPRPSSAADARIAVTTAERALSKAAKSGLGDAIAAQSDPLVRVYREGKTAAFGTPAAASLLAKDKRKVTCKPANIISAAAGDFAYAYGVCTAEGADTPAQYGFMRVWHMQADGSFKILADVTP